MPGDKVIGDSFQPFLFEVWRWLPHMPRHCENTLRGTVKCRANSTTTAIIAVRQVKPYTTDPQCNRVSKVQLSDLTTSLDLSLKKGVSIKNLYFLFLSFRCCVGLSDFKRGFLFQQGGYTPVHIASLHKHEMIVHLLVHTYGADASLRDYSGKRADQYPDNYVRVVAGHKTLERRPLKQRPPEKETTTTSSNSFMRIGSLNLRKARKSTVFASVRGGSRNRNSLGELRFGNHASIRKKLHKSMPPFEKKR
ncbi:hypothetical protein AVEN_214006-1 [Araneus ventricosus]|uniref:Uncharacterized protein n=1 Tax=Araneus ventricosus TaxID=182803 RepID=A0A4Y2NVU6_ARAVE|nr:hypothetical protein AVEN_214006-1 [Araneus ventricosus]